jgi:co-chaperonin GroES (HSP10)
MRTIRAMKNKILAEMIDKPGTEKTTAGGIIITEKDATEAAVRPRWFKVYSVGEGIDWIQKDNFVLVDHGRWSNGMDVGNEEKIYLLDNKDCLALSDTDPRDDKSLEVYAKSIPKRPSNDTTRHKL